MRTENLLEIHFSSVQRAQRGLMGLMDEDAPLQAILKNLAMEA